MSATFLNDNGLSDEEFRKAVKELEKSMIRTIGQGAVSKTERNVEAKKQKISTTANQIAAKLEQTKSKLKLSLKGNAGKKVNTVLEESKQQLEQLGS